MREFTYIDSPPPNEVVSLGELKVGDWVGKIGENEMFPERQLARISRPFEKAGNECQWGFGWNDGGGWTVVDYNGDMTAERLPPSEASRRNSLPANKSVRLIL